MKNIFKFEPVEIIAPTKIMLEKSIRNNIRLSDTFGFMFFGMLTLYSIYYVRTGTNDLSLLLLAILLALYNISHFIILKIDKARLEIYNATHEE